MSEKNYNTNLFCTDEEMAQYEAMEATAKAKAEQGFINQFGKMTAEEVLIQVHIKAMSGESAQDIESYITGWYTARRNVK